LRQNDLAAMGNNSYMAHRPHHTMSGHRSKAQASRLEAPRLGLRTNTIDSNKAAVCTPQSSFVMAVEKARKLFLLAPSLLLLAAAAFVLLSEFDSSKVGTNRDLLLDNEEESRPEKDQTSTCNCTLITSPGGVGSTQFLELVQNYEKEERLCTNHFLDFDEVKHRPATSFDHHDDTSIYHGAGQCFNKVLVIVGDPIHSIASTFRRHHKTDHLNKLRKAAKKPHYDEEIELESIFQEIEVAGEDTTGIVHYLDSWLAAANDRSLWPQTRIVTTKDLYNYAKANANYVGVKDEENLKYFDSLHFREPGRAEDVSERIREIFAPIQSKLEQASRKTLEDYLISLII
jgi:hypothetical protein